LLKSKKVAQMLTDGSAKIILALVSYTSLFCVSANAAPPHALNKTVTLSFTSFVPAHCDNGRDNQTPRETTQRIYISTKGRLFAEESAHARGYSREALAEPQSSPLHFSGSKLVGTLGVVSGAVQEIISFDPSYSRCSVEVIVGRESGKPFT
jgi:hypothetical protein